MRIPGRVQHQPTVSMTDDGHSTARRSVLPILIRCQTPNLQRRTSTAADTINPTALPTAAVCRVVIESILQRTTCTVRTTNTCTRRYAGGASIQRSQRMLLQAVASIWDLPLRKRYCPFVGRYTHVSCGPTRRLERVTAGWFGQHAFHRDIVDAFPKCS